MQHPRHDDVAGELRLAPQLLGGVAARSRSSYRACADLHLLDPAHARPCPAAAAGHSPARGYGVDRMSHVVTPARSQTASTIPR